ncbi:hypothetical protein NUG22_38090, partial [Saccharothrix longispora]|nr:hypothetical protein [Saccharothrix longispora]
RGPGLAPAPVPPAGREAGSAPRAFRTARVFDGAGPGGRPSVNRPPVPEADRDLLLSYLDRAPVAVVGRGFDADVLNPDATQVVPVAFQTDGQWIWPAAVGYYLRAYGVPPEPELVERAAQQDFVLPEVSEEARVAAAANLGAPAAPQGTKLPVAEPPEAPPEPVEVGATVVAPLPEPPADDPRQVRPDVEQTANLTDLKPEVVEYAQEGPPYRVRFEEDGPVIDDRYRRESYVDGMDLFAPVPAYDRDERDDHEARDDRPERVEPGPGDTQAWNPFSDDDPEPVAAEETAEVGAVADEADRPAEADTEHAPDEVTAEFEVAQEHLYTPVAHDDARFDEREDARFDEHDGHEDPHVEPHDDRDRHEDAAFEQHAEPAFAEQSFTGHRGHDGHDDHREHDHREHEDREERVESRFEEQDERHDDHERHDEHEHDDHDRDEHDEPRRTEDRDEAPAPFAEQVPPPFADQAPTRFTEAAQPFRDPTPSAPQPVQVTPPPPEEPRQVTPDEERELAGTRRTLDELDVPPAAYRFGEPVDRTWLLRVDGQDWEVSWFDRGPTNPVRFDRVEDATAYLIGKLVLAHRRAPRPVPPPL